MHKTVPATENDLAKNVNSAKTEKLWGILSLSDHKVMILLATVLLKYIQNKCSSWLKLTREPQNTSNQGALLQHQCKMSYLYPYAAKKASHFSYYNSLTRNHSSPWTPYIRPKKWWIYFAGVLKGAQWCMGISVKIILVWKILCRSISQNTRENHWGKLSCLALQWLSLLLTWQWSFSINYRLQYHYYILYTLLLSHQKSLAGI